jgi:hypothetical protein
MWTCTTLLPFAKPVVIVSKNKVLGWESEYKRESIWMVVKIQRTFTYHSYFQLILLRICPVSLHHAYYWARCILIGGLFICCRNSNWKKQMSVTINKVSKVTHNNCPFPAPISDCALGKFGNDISGDEWDCPWVLQQLLWASIRSSLLNNVET